jgi:hypothetical protein
LDAKTKLEKFKKNYDAELKLKWHKRRKSSKKLPKIQARGKLKKLGFHQSLMKNLGISFGF